MIADIEYLFFLMLTFTNVSIIDMKNDKLKDINF